MFEVTTSTVELINSNDAMLVSTNSSHIHPIIGIYNLLVILILPRYY